MTALRSIGVFIVVGVLAGGLYLRPVPHRLSANDVVEVLPEYVMPTTIPAGLPGPSPDYGPGDVVRLVVRALQHNDDPEPQAGIMTTFKFSSPMNQQAVGPLPHFIQVVHSETYAPFINHQAAEFGRPPH